MRSVAVVRVFAPHCKLAPPPCKRFHHHPSRPLLTIRKGCDDEMQGCASKCAKVDSYSLTACNASSRSVVLHPVASLHLQLENRTVITLQDLHVQQETMVVMTRFFSPFFLLIDYFLTCGTLHSDSQTVCLASPPCAFLLPVSSPHRQLAKTSTGERSTAI